MGELTRNGVSFLAHNNPVSVEKSVKGKLQLVTDKERIDTDIIIFALGVKPNIALAEATGLAIGSSGAIQVDAFQQTSKKKTFLLLETAVKYITGSVKPG